MVLLLVAVESCNANDVVYVIPRASALRVSKAESARLVPAMDEMTRLPAAFWICALDRLI